MADNVAVTAGAGTTIAADEVTDATLGTVKVQFVKIMSGTLDGTEKAAVGANGLAVSAAQAGTWTVVIDSGPTGASALQHQGTASHDAAYSGRPVAVGGWASAAAPTDVSADGDAVRGWYLRNGAAATVLTAAGALIGGDAANGLDVDVTRLPAGENHVGQVGAPGDVVDVTLTLDTLAYASGDLLADTQSFTGARVSGGRAVLQSVTVIDEDDQGVAFDLWFLSANNSLGTENAAPTISDASARDVLGYVSVATTDYKDLGGVKVATLRGLGLVLEAAGGSTSLYVAAVNGSGAPTFTASGLKLKLGLLQL